MLTRCCNTSILRRSINENRFLFKKRWFCSNNIQKPVLITTPIYYVNDRPHIGHLYSTLLADSLGRWFRLKGREVLVSTGTDEHGLKVQKEAEKRNKTPQEHCDYHSNEFRKMFDTFNIKYDRFIRTTDDDHIKAVTNIWNILMEKGFIKQGVYSGWYCTSDEEFVTEDDINFSTDPNGPHLTKHSGKEVEWTEETNYLFQIGKQKDLLKEFVQSGRIFPPERVNQISNGITNMKEDLSVSRSVNRVSWGIPVPSDSSQTLYVWLDALTNYLTVTGYPNEEYKRFWPPEYQILGKDITTFHCIYWPAFLMAAEIETPKKLICHAHWTKDRVKMSKSLKNIVDPMSCIDKYTVDMLRFYLLHEGGILDDGDFSFNVLDSRVNGDLCNHFGNLLSRSTAKSINSSGIYPKSNDIILPGIHQKLLDNLKTLPQFVETSFEEVNFAKGIKEIFSCIRDCNVFFEENAPWQLAKEGKIDERDQVLYTTYETLRIASTLLQPIIPESSSKALDKLEIPQECRMQEHGKYGVLDEIICKKEIPKEPIVLFTKIQDEKEQVQTISKSKKNKSQKKK